jgi:hypothetical protein
MGKQPNAWAHPERDFKYRAGCTLRIDPEKTQIRRVIRTPGTVADDGELERMRRYLLDGFAPPNAFMGVAERFKESAERFLPPRSSRRPMAQWSASTVSATVTVS